MKNLTIDAQTLRAAMACQSDKQDVRYYLRGILLAANGDVVGTNGHVLYKGASAERPERDTIVQIHGTIPAGATTVELDFTNNIARTDKGKVFPLEIIDGRYPDYPLVIPTLPRAAPDTTVSVNPQYLALSAKVFGTKKIVLHLGAVGDALLITNAKDADLMVIVSMRT